MTDINIVTRLRQEMGFNAYLNIEAATLITKYRVALEELLEMSRGDPAIFKFDAPAVILDALTPDPTEGGRSD